MVTLDVRERRAATSAPLAPARGRRAQGPALAWVAHAAGAALLAATVVVTSSQLHTIDPLVSARIYTAATVFVLIGAIASRRLGAVYLITAFYFTVFTAAPTLVQIERNQFPFGSRYSDLELNAGFLVIAIGQLSLLAGVAALGRARTPPPTLRCSQTAGTARNESKLAARLGAGMSLAAAALAALAGPSRVFSPRFDESGSVLTGESLATQLIFVARALSVVGLLLTILAAQLTRPRRGGRIGALALSAGVALVVNFPPALPRFQLLGVVLAVSVLLFDFHRPAVKAVFTVGATAFLLYLFAAIKDLGDGVSLDEIASRDIAQYLVTVDFDSFKQITDTVIYFAEAPFRLGENFLGAALFWVPRSVWEGKPIHTGQIVSSGLGYTFFNVSNPLPAEAYASWGIAGTVLVMFAVGLILGRIEGRGTAPRGPRAHVPALLTYALAAGYATILLRGALNAVAPMILSAFVLAALVHFVFRIPPPSRSTQFHTQTRTPDRLPARERKGVKE